MAGSAKAVRYQKQQHREELGGMKVVEKDVTDFRSVECAMCGAPRPYRLSQIAAIDEFDVYDAKHTAIAGFARGAERAMAFLVENGRRA